MPAAFITGSTSGIGLALAHELANRGFSLALCGRRKEALGALLRSLPTDLRKSQPSTEQRFTALHFDLAEPQDYPALVQQAIDAIGAIDYLVLNAGLSQKGFFEQTDPQVEDTLWRVNYQSTVDLTRAMLPHLIEQGGGQIVALGSIAGKYGAPYLTTYSATKHAIYGFYESLRYEVEDKGVRVLTVTPGFIRTDIAKKALNESGGPARQDSKAQANGIAPEKAARRIAQAMTQKRNGNLLIAGKEVVFLYLRRFSPKLFHWVLKKLHHL